MYKCRHDYKYKISKDIFLSYLLSLDKFIKYNNKRETLLYLY